MSISTVLPDASLPPVNFISNNQLHSNIQGGSWNSINSFGDAHNAIGGGFSNAIGGDNTDKQISGNTAYAVICGGFDNRILGFDSQGEFIGGGYSNDIRTGSQSSILGGANNFITYSIRASILGGRNNRIDNSIVAGNYASIINGQDNIVSHTSSVILGGDSLISDDTYTTFTRGLNVSSGGVGGNKYFKYHGGLSNDGTIGDVLTTVDTFGNAIWMKPCCYSGGTTPTTGSTFEKYCSTSAYTANIPIVHTHEIGGPSGACGVVINIWDEDGYKVEGEVRELSPFQIEVTLSETQNNVKVVII